MADYIVTIEDGKIVEANELVTCEVCRWRDKPYCCPMNMDDLTSEDYCSYGERRADG